MTVFWVCWVEFLSFLEIIMGSLAVSTKSFTFIGIEKIGQVWYSYAKGSLIFFFSFLLIYVLLVNTWQYSVFIYSWLCSQITLSRRRGIYAVSGVGLYSATFKVSTHLLYYHSGPIASLILEWRVFIWPGSLKSMYVICFIFWKYSFKNWYSST